jgi:hypothetical protein
MKTMELSESEVRVIEEIRQKDEQGRATRRTALEVLRTAFEYERWLQREGMGSTYSTFCDDFGYGAESRIFELVQQVRKIAYGERI